MIHLWLCPAPVRLTPWGYGHQADGTYQHWRTIPQQPGIGWQRSTCRHCHTPILGPFTDDDWWVELFVILEEEF